MPLSQRSFMDEDSFSSKDEDVKWISERHVACVFLLDVSSSMAGRAIKQLNKGLQTFKEQTLNNPSFDAHTKSCIDVALITFSDKAEVIQDFVPIEDMETPVLQADGMTAMGAALNLAMDIITERKQRYNDLGTPYYRPWIFCITDGEPNDNYADAIFRLKQMEQNKGVLGYCVGVEHFDRSVMASIFEQSRIFELKNLDFPALFEFVSNSLGAIRESDPNCGREIDVPAPSTLKLAF